MLDLQKFCDHVSGRATMLRTTELQDRKNDSRLIILAIIIINTVIPLGKDTSTPEMTIDFCLS